MFKNLKTLIPWSVQKNIRQLQIIGANDSFIFTKDQKIVDFTSGAMAVNLGHNNKYILEGFNNHYKTGISYVPSNFSTYEREKLSDRLTEIFNQYYYKKVLYTNAGAESNEFAIFLTKEYFRLNNIENRNRTLSFKNSFHGGSSIAASLVSGDIRRENKSYYYNLPLEPIISNPDKLDKGKDSLNQFENEFKKKDVASILVEGSSGTAGCYLYPKGYFKELKLLCEKYNVLMICDEVMSGWGRTGNFFAHMEHKVKPDLITTAKAITSGYVPLGAVIIKDNVSDMFNDNIVMGGLTYSGHILPCTIANRCIDLYQENNYQLLDEVNVKSKYITDRCNKIVNNHNFIKEFRNNGMLGCFELNLSNSKLIELSNLLLYNGIYCLRMRNNLFISPPLNINPSLLHNSFNIMDQIFYIFNEDNF